MFRRSSLLAGLLALGCSMPAYVATAYHGDLPTLSRQIHDAADSGQLDAGHVEELARAIARRELRSASGAAAMARVRASRACVSAVAPELRERAATKDDAGASAMLVLAESGEVGRGGLADDYGSDASGAWRAVAAFGTAKKKYAALRRRFYVDPDQRVRREALRAGLQAEDPADLAALLEAARLDPDLQNRSLATRAAGAIGGVEARTGLVDLWARADATEQISIVEAWSMPRSFSAGGAEEIVRVAEAEDSLASVAAAGALVRLGAEGHEQGAAVLQHSIEHGTTDERLVAIDLVSLANRTVVAALERAAKADDAEVRVAALARLLDVPASRASARAQLETAAAGADAATRQARIFLVKIGDPKAGPLLEQDLSSAGPSSRVRAAVGLFQLGKPEKMAGALADPDPSVRMGVACSVIGRAATSG